VKAIRIAIKCVIQITESFKTALDILLDFFYQEKTRVARWHFIFASITVCTNQVHKTVSL